MSSKSLGRSVAKLLSYVINITFNTSLNNSFLILLKNVSAVQEARSLWSALKRTGRVFAIKELLVIVVIDAIADISTERVAIFAANRAVNVSKIGIKFSSV